MMTASSVPSCVIAVKVAPGIGRRRQELADDAQVRARRDRQELGQALDQAEDDRLDEIHARLPASSSAAGRENPPAKD